VIEKSPIPSTPDTPTDTGDSSGKGGENNKADTATASKNEEQPPKKTPQPTVESKSDLQTLIANLRSKEIRVRASACEGLGKLGPAARPAIPLLVETMRDDDNTLRTAAGTALDNIGLFDKTQLDLILSCLTDKQVEVRRFAVRSLRELECDDAKVCRAVVKLLADSDSGIRKDVVALLGRFAETAPSESLTALLRALGDSELRAIAMEELKKFSPLDAGDVPVLRQALKGKTAEARTYAVRQLGHLGPKAKEAQLDLTESLKDAKGDFRHLVVLALVAIDPDKFGGIAGQLAALTDEEAGLRQRGALALTESHEEGKMAIPALIALLNDKDAQVRVAALLALEKIGAGTKAKDAVSATAKLLKDSEANVRVAAVLLLAKIGKEPDAFLPQLIESLKDENSDVRANTLVVLGMQGRNAKDAVGQLRRSLVLKEEGKDRALVLWSIGKIGPDAKAAVPDLIQMLKEQDENRRVPILDALAGIGKPAVSPLVDALKERDPWIRLGAVQALEKMGPTAKGAIGPLSGRYTGDPMPEIRSAAKKALAAIQAKEPEPFTYPKAPPLARPKPALLAFSGLQPVNEDKKPDNKPVQMKPPGQLGDLVTQLRSNDAKERLTAIRELGGMKAGAKPATRELCALIVRSKDAERQAAFEALEQIDPGLYARCVPLVVGTNQQQALIDLSAMKSRGHDALPIVLALAKIDHLRTRGRLAFEIMAAAAAIAPGEPEVNDLLLMIASDVQFQYAVPTALKHLSDWAKQDPKLRTRLLEFIQRQLTTGRETHAVELIQTLGKVGPEAKEFLPLLKKLKLSEQAGVRDAAKAAVEQIEKAQ
jgi:HEAT repeat protein